MGHSLLACRRYRRRGRSSYGHGAKWIQHAAHLSCEFSWPDGGTHLLSQQQCIVSPRRTPTLAVRPYTLPAATGPTAAAQLFSVGNFVNSSGAAVAPGSAPGYPDFYLAGRAPEFSFFNFGIERVLTKNITLSANYAGSESHFIAGASNIRGIQSGEVDPKYMPILGAGTYGLGLLSKPATAANVAAAQAAMPSCCAVPYAGFQAIAATGTSAGNNATIAQMLKWMPQFSSTSDTWGNIANANYHALQISATHGLRMD